MSALSSTFDCQGTHASSWLFSPKTVKVTDSPLSFPAELFTLALDQVLVTDLNVLLILHLPEGKAPGVIFGRKQVCGNAQSFPVRTGECH